MLANPRLGDREERCDVSLESRARRKRTDVGGECASGIGHGRMISSFAPSGH
jgi:hypothetical protein